MRKYGYIFLTIFLIVSLGFPFVLKLRNPGLEIYPAVIFPAGAGLANNNVDTLTVASREFYGIKSETGESKMGKIEKAKFFRGIPLHYISYIQAGGFGLEEFIGESKLYTPALKFPVRNNFTPVTLEETKDWFRERLREQEMKDSVFYVRLYRINYEVPTNSVLSKELINEAEYIIH